MSYEDQALPSLCFTVNFKVRFTDFSTNYPMLLTTETNSFQCHGLGPAYGADRGRISAYLYTVSEKGPHGRGIYGNAEEGWVKSVPLVSFSYLYIYKSI